MKPVRFTSITSGHGPLTKRIELDENGRIKKTAAAQLSRGTFEVRQAEGLGEFAKQLELATPEVAFAYGIPDEPTGIIVREEDRELVAGSISRTRKHFGWSAGAGIMMGDSDGGIPISRDEPVDFIRDYLPFLSTVELLERPSSSSNLYNAETGKWLPGNNNCRFYFIVSDASRIPEIGKLISDLFWAQGYGWYDVSRAGTLLKRCPLDTSVWQPERLDFVGGAVTKSPLAQRPLIPVLHDAPESLLHVRYLPRLSDSDREQIRHYDKSAREEVEQERQRVRAAYLEIRAKELTDKGVDPERARNAVNQALDTRELLADFEITLSTGTVLTVSEILAAPERYHGQRCCDPLEPEYRGDTRVAYINLKGGRKPFIHSHAHGGARYVLAPQTREIRIAAGQTAITTDQICRYLVEDGEVYERGGVPVVVGDDAKTKVCNSNSMQYQLGKNYNLVRFDQRNGNWVATDPTEKLCKQIIGRGGFGVFPKLSGIITAPTMTPSGRMLFQAGYDRQTQLLMLVEDEEERPEIPKRPSRGQLSMAYETLWYPFKDFPFDSVESRSVHLAALLTAVVRPTLIASPAFAYDAPTQGSGKTKLALCTAALATGRQEALYPPPDTDEETRKKLTTALLNSRPVIVFDNMDAVLKSATLASFLTSPSWSDRVLGANAEMEAENRSLLMFTGNNLQTSGDMARRTLTSRIDPRIDANAVWQREFQIEPVDYVTRHRQDLVAAALTLIQGYMAAGSPKGVKGSLASFEHWDGLVRQCIVWLGEEGIAGVCDPVRKLIVQAESDPEILKLAALATTWFTQYGERYKTLAEVALSPDMETVLKDVATDRAGKLNPRVLASYLRQRVGKIVKGYQFESKPGRSSTMLWRVMREAGVGADGGFGGFEGINSAQLRKDKILIADSNTEGLKTYPSTPPNPPVDDLDKEFEACINAPANEQG